MYKINLKHLKLKLQRACVYEREKFYCCQMLNMTYETKNITFHVIHVKVSSGSWCSRTLLMNVASAHCDYERDSCKDKGWSKICGNHSWMWSKVEHCIKLCYSDSQTCFGQSVHNRLLPSHVSQHLVSHRNVSKLSCMEAIVQMVDNRIGFNMY